MYPKIENDNYIEIQLKFQDLPILSVFLTVPKVGGTGLNYTATNYVVITSKLLFLTEQ